MSMNVNEVITRAAKSLESVGFNLALQARKVERKEYTKCHKTRKAAVKILNMCQEYSKCICAVEKDLRLVVDLCDRKLQERKVKDRKSSIKMPPDIDLEYFMSCKVIVDDILSHRKNKSSDQSKADSEDHSERHTDNNEQRHSENHQKCTIDYQHTSGSPDIDDNTAIIVLDKDVPQSKENTKSTKDQRICIAATQIGENYYIEEGSSKPQEGHSNTKSDMDDPVYKKSSKEKSKRRDSEIAKNLKRRLLSDSSSNSSDQDDKGKDSLGNKPEQPIKQINNDKPSSSTEVINTEENSVKKDQVDKGKDSLGNKAMDNQLSKKSSKEKSKRRDSEIENNLKRRLLRDSSSNSSDQDDKGKDSVGNKPEQPIKQINNDKPSSSTEVINTEESSVKKDQVDKGKDSLGNKALDDKLSKNSSKEKSKRRDSEIAKNLKRRLLSDSSSNSSDQDDKGKDSLGNKPEQPIKQINNDKPSSSTEVFNTDESSVKKDQVDKGKDSLGNKALDDKLSKNSSKEKSKRRDSEIAKNLKRRLLSDSSSNSSDQDDKGKDSLGNKPEQPIKQINNDKPSSSTEVINTEENSVKKDQVDKGKDSLGNKAMDNQLSKKSSKEKSKRRDSEIENNLKRRLLRDSSSKSSDQDDKGKDSLANKVMDDKVCKKTSKEKSKRRDSEMEKKNLRRRLLSDSSNYSSNQDDKVKDSLENEAEKAIKQINNEKQSSFADVINRKESLKLKSRKNKEKNLTIEIKDLKVLLRDDVIDENLLKRNCIATVKKDGQTVYDINQRNDLLSFFRKRSSDGHSRDRIGVKKKLLYDSSSSDNESNDKDHSDLTLVKIERDESSSASQEVLQNVDSVENNCDINETDNITLTRDEVTNKGEPKNIASIPSLPEEILSPNANLAPLNNSNNDNEANGSNKTENITLMRDFESDEEEPNNIIAALTSLLEDNETQIEDNYCSKEGSSKPQEHSNTKSDMDDQVSKKPSKEKSRRRDSEMYKKNFRRRLLSSSSSNSSGQDDKGEDSLENKAMDDQPCKKPSKEKSVRRDSEMSKKNSRRRLLSSASSNSSDQDNKGKDSLGNKTGQPIKQVNNDKPFSSTVVFNSRESSVNEDQDDKGKDPLGNKAEQAIKQISNDKPSSSAEVINSKESLKLKSSKNKEKMLIKEIKDLKVLLTDDVMIDENLLKRNCITTVIKNGEIIYDINGKNDFQSFFRKRSSDSHPRDITGVKKKLLHDLSSSDNELSDKVSSDLTLKEVSQNIDSEEKNCDTNETNNITLMRDEGSNEDEPNITEAQVLSEIPSTSANLVPLNKSNKENEANIVDATISQEEIKRLLLEDDDELASCSQNINVRSSPSCDESSSSESDETKAFALLKKTIAERKKLKRTTSGNTSSADSDTSSSRNTKHSHKRKKNRRTKKASSSSGSDTSYTTQQDKLIDGLTNLKSLARRRVTRRCSAKKINVMKEKIIMSRKIEEVLKAERSSSDDSDSNSTASEELPTVPITELNGGPEHLVKEDLLCASDSSSSSDKQSVEATSQDVDSSDSKSKRRKTKTKTITINSDSDGGPSRKNSDVEEQSEAETNGVTKNKRKKIKLLSSDDDSDSSEIEAGKKKRRRIKQIKDSEESGSDSENEGKKHGRKNIRRVMGKDQLEEATKRAAREEKERVARISERQKLYNNLAFDESGKPDEVVLDKVVLDFDPETKEPLIQVDRGLVKKLKPHQANGIKFMWDACFESVKRIKKDKGSGCILAHCMGLGKTLQVVSLTHTLITHSELTGVNRILVVCPLSTVLNWVNEYKMWLEHAEDTQEIDIYELSRYKQNSERAYQLQSWLDNGGICVLGYEMFRNLSADNSKKFRKKMLKSFQESLVNPGPDLVVCDEGHLLKNEKTSLSQSMNKVKTLRRIVLTGTPLQNNLKEYYCMVQFVKPNLLGKFNEYLNRFVNPITNGQYTDSTELDIKVMKRRSHVLHKLLDGAVQRRDYGVLAPFLPPKHEYVLFITLTDIQVKLYQHYLENYSRRPLLGKTSGFLFPDFQSLQRIWTHPLVLKYNSARYEIMQQKKRDKEEEEDSEGSLADFIDDDSTSEDSTSEDESDSMSDMSDDSHKKSKNKKNTKKSKSKESKAPPRRGTRANPNELLEDDKVIDLVDEGKSDNPTEWWIPLVTEDELEDLRHSHKLVLLFDILRQCEAIGDKLLVFSQSLYSLDLIEHFLKKIDEATQDGKIDDKLGGHVGSWSPGVDYFRLDGSSNCENRSIWCKHFNREDNPRARLFLISTRAGGLGINLVAANRVVIFDVSWNPSHDVQSIFRVYRFGQKKPCYIYRFLAMGTMEEKIYERQVTKQAISKRVIDEQQIDRHYAENDLSELYKFEPVPVEPRTLPPLPKDRLFAEMLKEYEKQIFKYHEHDSLLENKEEETLTEEERKAAWEDFENEKKNKTVLPFGNQWNMQGLLQQQQAQQQQQFALNAVITMLRKDYPNMTEQQMAGMLPLIYNANPGLMQKMNEIYKYANPALMNPAAGMMNPGPLSSTSSLQYEPPWQRQQQQQQQLRLQQMMQQQQSMNAKYYAGGLGSRDPIAMALQQQRAREMLVGERIDRGDARGRPRGRPPLHRPPPVTTDVVDLDSD